MLRLGSVDFKKEKDVVKRRAVLDKVRGGTRLVTTALARMRADGGRFDAFAEAAPGNELYAFFRHEN